MKSLLFFLLTVVLMTGGCTHVMSEAGLAVIDRSITYSDIKKSPEALAGKVILVGGVIAETRSSGDVMQIEIAQLDLLTNGVPDDTSHSGGRFLAVSGELLDPLFYRPGMLITLIGEIKGQKIQSLDGAEYRYPVISAKEIRLFRASDSFSGSQNNPYQNKVSDGRSMLRPPGITAEEPRRP